MQWNCLYTFNSVLHYLQQVYYSVISDGKSNMTAMPLKVSASRAETERDECQKHWQLNIRAVAFDKHITQKLDVVWCVALYLLTSAAVVLNYDDTFQVSQ